MTKKLILKILQVFNSKFGRFDTYSDYTNCNTNRSTQVLLWLAVRLVNSALLDGTTTSSYFILNYCGVLYKRVILVPYITSLVANCSSHSYICTTTF